MPYVHWMASRATLLPGRRGGGVLLLAAGGLDRRVGHGCTGQRQERRVLRSACQPARDRTFPQARWVAAAESGTGSLLGATIGRYPDAEQSLAADLLGCFGPGMLVLADRKFLSWSAARAFLPPARTSCGAPRRRSPSGRCRF